jgi:uncharacterized lipoprotein YddW (UPF0748 family)
MRKTLSIFILLSMPVAILGPWAAQAEGEKGIFLASTGPTSEYCPAFWWRQSPEQLGKLLDRFHKAGVNEVYPCAYGHGVYLFKTSRAVFPKGVVADRLTIDPLAELIEQAHARDMKVIPFFPFLVAGGAEYVAGASGGEVPHPDWFCLDTNGEQGATLSFDPAHPEVRNYLNNMVEDLLAYDIDGLMLDYIRYLGTHMGYTPLARESFKKEAGVDPLDLIKHPETFDTNIVYCLKPTSWAGKDWYLSSLLAMMNRINVPHKIVQEDAHALDALPKNGTLLIAAYYDIPEATIEKIDHFVTNGGNVIFLDAPTTAMKKHGEKLGPVLGMKSTSQYSARQEREIRVATAHPITEGVKTGTLLCSANALTEIEPGSAQILATFADAKSAVILNKHEKGRCVLFNFNLLLKYDGDRGVELLGTTVGWLLADGRGEADSGTLVEFNTAWNAWRCRQVTEVVKMVRDTMKKHKPSLILSAATTPRKYHVNCVFQDWKTWVRNGYIDCVYPMDYFANNQELKDALEWQCQGLPKSKIVPILALYKREGKETVPVAPDKLTSQMEIVEALGCSGVSLFSNMRLSEELESALAQRWTE